MVHPTVVHPTVVHPTVVHAVVGKRRNFIAVSQREACRCHSDLGIPRSLSPCIPMFLDIAIPKSLVKWVSPCRVFGIPGYPPGKPRTLVIWMPPLKCEWNFANIFKFHIAKQCVELGLRRYFYFCLSAFRPCARKLKRSVPRTALH